MLLLLLLLVLAPVLDEAAAVLEGEAALLAGEGRELVLVHVKVAVELKGLAAVELLPTILALYREFFLFG